MSLWNDAGDIDAIPQRDLACTEIKALLQAGPVDFVVVCVGCPLRWITGLEVYDFFKTQAKPRLVEPSDDPDGFFLGDFPDHCAYTAQEWTSTGRSSIVVFTIHH